MSTMTLEQAIRIMNPEPKSHEGMEAWQVVKAHLAQPAQAVDYTGRSATDYAIEHAGYLVTAVKDFLHALGEESVASDQHENEPTDETLESLEAAQESVSDARSAVQNCLYEFEKRRDRALSGEKAGPVGKYRLLGPNDVIEPDDEFIDDNAVDWVRAGSASGGHLFIGMQYRLGVLKQARRPLPASPAPDKGGQS